MSQMSCFSQYHDLPNLSEQLKIVIVLLLKQLPALIVLQKEDYFEFQC